jgi:hypothetical protein
MCISAGASVCGAIWNAISTPSTVRRSTGCTIRSVGGSRVEVPAPVRLPSPAST